MSLPQTDKPLPIVLPLEQIRASCAECGVEEFSLFGSVLRGDSSSDRDIDVMMRFKSGHVFTFENTLDIHDDLRRIFAPREVGVIEKGRIANPFRRQAIMSNHRVIRAA